MNTARQILRFSVPGSIFLLHGFLCYLIFRRLQGVQFVDASTAIKANIAAVIAVLSTIPIGFVIYQIYYFTYEPVLRLWPLPWSGRFVRRDRGGAILRKLDSGQISDLEKILKCVIEPEEPHCEVEKAESLLEKCMQRTGVLEIAGVRKTLPTKGGERQDAYENLWYTHWDALRTAVDIAGSYPGSKEVKAEYTTLSDIYHALGAARTAVLSAWTGVLLLSLLHIGRIWDGPLAAAGGVVAISGITTVLYLVFHISRGRTWRSAEASLTMGLRWLQWRHGHELGQPNHALTN